ncbi:MAG TPA: AAA family ATPase [Candidatus Nanopelagicaceae bacterium]|nr:AAA family ATPase [Candidatus Nanopelagicaceae bacterium]
MSNDLEDASEINVFSAFALSGLWPGLGKTAAQVLLQAHINSPDDVTVENLLGIPGNSRKRAERLVRAFHASNPIYRVAEQLIIAGCEPKAAAIAINSYGSSAFTVITNDPWSLLACGALDVPAADKFALFQLDDISPSDSRRGKALVQWALRQGAKAGSTALPRPTVAQALARNHFPDVEAAVADSERDGLVIDYGDALALDVYAFAEEQIALGLVRLEESASKLCQPEAIATVSKGLDAEQIAAIAQVALHGVSLLTGGPGTGKSRTVRAIVDLCNALDIQIALAAPTGRAAKRLEELTDLEAVTLHRLLGAQGTTGTFLRGEAWPLDVQVLVVDEASMIDAELAAALVLAIPDGAHLLLVGDPAQLPSIGPGQFLKDLIDSEVFPMTELVTLHRQEHGGAIARLATSVRNGEFPAVANDDQEVFVIGTTNSDECAHRVVQLVTDSIPRALSISPNDIQVLTPIHRGRAGTGALNEALKAALNPGPGAVFGYDIGDRVVATANHLDDGFANGEVGTVTQLDGRNALRVDFGQGPCLVPAKDLSDLKHGWAVTIHRSQGSEWPAVIVVLPGEAGSMLNRPLIYTALTRAQQHLSIVYAGNPGVIANAIASLTERPRSSRLSQLVRETR